MTVINLRAAGLPAREVRPLVAPFAALLDGLLEAVWMIDGRTRCIVAVNRAATALRGMAEAQLLQTSDVIKLQGGRVLERFSLPQFSRGRPIGRVYSFRDLSEKLAASQRIEELAHHDMLTGLPNRRALAERVDHAQAVARREGAAFALLTVDLDRFKQINDTLGHTYGDRVLKDVAERLKASLREVDTVATSSAC